MSFYFVIFYVNLFVIGNNIVELKVDFIVLLDLIICRIGYGLESEVEDEVVKVEFVDEFGKGNYVL